MAWVYVENGVVKDRVTVSPATVFHPAYAEMFVEAPDEVEWFWTYDGTNFAPPPQPSQAELTTKKAEEVRAERNRLLAETDWTQVADVPQASRDKWVAYRQALRDVPAQPGFPENITWPQKPA